MPFGPHLHPASIDSAMPIPSTSLVRLVVLTILVSHTESTRLFQVRYLIHKPCDASLYVPAIASLVIGLEYNNDVSIYLQLVGLPRMWLFMISE